MRIYLYDFYHLIMIIQTNKMIIYEDLFFKPKSTLISFHCSLVCLFVCAFIWIVVIANDVIISAIALAWVAYSQYIVVQYIHIEDSICRCHPRLLFVFEYEIPYTKYFSEQNSFFVSANSYDCLIYWYRCRCHSRTRKQKSQFTQKRVWNEK